MRRFIARVGFRQKFTFAQPYLVTAMPIQSIRMFSAVNITFGNNRQAINPDDTDGTLRSNGIYTVGNGTGQLVQISDTDDGTGGDTAGTFDDGTGANQVLNEAVTLRHDSASGIRDTTFPPGTQVQAEFTVTFSSGYSIIGLRFENPDAPPNLITAGYTITDSSGNPVIPPPGTNLGSVVSTGNNGSIPYDNVACFASGTRIETPEGHRAVERLHVGDMVLTADNGPRPIRWIGRRHIGPEALAANPGLRPIRIRAGALAPQAPMQDLVVSPQHRMLVRSRIAIRMFGASEVFVSAKMLLGVDGVALAEDLAEVTYLHIMCDDHEIIRAEGALTETLYTGSEAIKAMGPAARLEIASIFGDLPYLGRPLARPAPQGKQARRLVGRHIKNEKAIFSDGL